MRIVGLVERVSRVGRSHRFQQQASHKLLVLHDISDKAAEEGGRRVRCSNHEHKAFCLHFIDRDWSTIGILGGWYIVTEVTSLISFRILESLFEKLVSKLRWLSIQTPSSFAEQRNQSYCHDLSSPTLVSRLGHSETAGNWIFEKWPCKPGQRTNDGCERRHVMKIAD